MMIQQSLFDEDIVLKAPNVSKVPQYSPLRYPGGKTWLYPFAKRWLINNKDNILIEPFAGGASIGLAAAIEGWVKRVILVEKDADVFSLWHTIIEGDAEWLTDKIIHFDFTEGNVNRVLAGTNGTPRDKAFALILNNRISRSGIVAPGAGRVRHGENGKGIKSRWYPQTLQRRILTIARHKEKISVIHGDATDMIHQHIHDKDVLFFMDPPYTKAGKRLYPHSEIDHERLFASAACIKGGLLMTYDHAEEIVRFAHKNGFRYEKILMQTAHHLRKYELLIGKDLSWLSSQFRLSAVRHRREAELRTGT